MLAASDHCVIGIVGNFLPDGSYMMRTSARLIVKPNLSDKLSATAKDKHELLWF